VNKPNKRWRIRIYKNISGCVLLFSPSKKRVVRHALGIKKAPEHLACGCGDEKINSAAETE